MPTKGQRFVWDTGRGFSESPFVEPEHERQIFRADRKIQNISSIILKKAIDTIDMELSGSHCGRIMQ
jgi:hypothetical protein